MGRSSDPLQQFKRTLRYGSFEDAWRMAQHLPVSLSAALRLTILAARDKSPRFEPLALRLVALLLEQRRLTIAQLRWVAERFQDAGEGREQEAERALRRFLERRSR